ncbi:hypothetical protein [Streptomyces sp. CoH17]|uniref:hypothetical protein n=1 Tax=Streptomyces sp. CoH17 TaxID=2992806 RepID=UPI0022718185|nr:hypothetical protein [Streptomyces sp. CoH17]
MEQAAGKKQVIDLAYEYKHDLWESEHPEFVKAFQDAPPQKMTWRQKIFATVKRYLGLDDLVDGFPYPEGCVDFSHSEAESASAQPDDNFVKACKCGVRFTAKSEKRVDQLLMGHFAEADRLFVESGGI